MPSGIRPAFALALVGCTPGTGGGGATGTSVTAAAAATSPSQVHVTIEAQEAPPEPVPVAVACARRDRAAEVHLAEGLLEARSLDLVLAGLAADTDYDCTAVALDGGAPASTPVRTPTLPFEAVTASVRGDPADATGGYTVMSARPECHGIDQNALTVLDADGENRWHHPIDEDLNLGVDVHSDGPGRVLWGGGEAPVGAPTVTDVVEGDVWSLSFPGSEDVVFHHDAKRIADGRVLSLELNEDPGWEAFQLRLSDDAGATTWFWDVTRAVDEGWLRDGGRDLDDPHHANWADVVDAGAGPVAYVSLCFSYQIAAIDATTGEREWVFGHGGDFTLEDADGQPLGPEEYPQCQHGLDVDGTNLLVYDNGFDRGFTRAVEFALDPARGVATKTWDWRDDGFFERYHGGVEWLDPEHDRVLVVEAANDCGEAAVRSSQIVELDRPDGDREVHRLILDDPAQWIYNAHRVDGCALFADAQRCEAVAERVDQLRPALGW